MERARIARGENIGVGVTIGHLPLVQLVLSARIHGVLSDALEDSRHPGVIDADEIAGDDLTAGVVLEKKAGGDLPIQGSVKLRIVSGALSKRRQRVQIEAWGARG